MEQTRQKQTFYSDHRPQELAKLIRKLRWIGMEEEVLVGPFSTD